MWHDKSIKEIERITYISDAVVEAIEKYLDVIPKLDSSTEIYTHVSDKRLLYESWN